MAADCCGGGWLDADWPDYNRLVHAPLCTENSIGKHMNLPDILQSFLWTAITAACYLAGLGLRRLARKRVLANPALIAMILVAILLLATHTAYAVYFRATWVLTFLRPGG